MRQQHPTHKAASTPGVYQLRLVLPKQTRLTVGRLGTFDFPPGVYVYTGSALGGLEQRLARHQRRRKKMHWHIDYLLRHARIVRIATRRTRRRLECSWNARTLRLANAVRLKSGTGVSPVRSLLETTDRQDACPTLAVLRAAGARVIAPGFGSSDCDCATHLVYLGQRQHGHL